MPHGIEEIIPSQLRDAFPLGVRQPVADLQCARQSDPRQVCEIVVFEKIPLDIGSTVRFDNPTPPRTSRAARFKMLHVVAQDRPLVHDFHIPFGMVLQNDGIVACRLRYLTNRHLLNGQHWRIASCGYHEHLAWSQLLLDLDVRRLFVPDHRKMAPDREIGPAVFAISHRLIFSDH